MPENSPAADPLFLKSTHSAASWLAVAVPKRFLSLPAGFVLMRVISKVFMSEYPPWRRLAFGRERIASEGIALPDLSVPAVNKQFRGLALGELSCGVGCSCL